MPKPIQRPRVPIMVGGNGPNVTWRLAARLADELNVDGMTPAEVAAALPVIRSRCEEINRDPATLPVSVHIWAEALETGGSARVDLLAGYRELGVSRVMGLIHASATTDEALDLARRGCPRRRSRARLDGRPIVPPGLGERPLAELRMVMRFERAGDHGGDLVGPAIDRPAGRHRSRPRARELKVSNFASGPATHFFGQPNSGAWTSHWASSRIASLTVAALVTIWCVREVGDRHLEGWPETRTCAQIWSWAADVERASLNPFFAPSVGPGDVVRNAVEAIGLASRPSRSARGYAPCPCRRSRRCPT